MREIFFNGNFKMKSYLIFLLFTIPCSIFTLHAQTWSNIGSGLNSSVNALAIYENNIIAGGFFDSAGGYSANRIAKWDGTKWDSIKIGVNGKVLALAVINDTLLYVGGSFNYAFNSGTPLGVNNIAQWSGGLLSAVSQGVEDTVSALCAYNGNLIIGGTINNAGGKPVNNVAVFDGANFSTLDSGFNNSVKALLVYNGNLIAGGTFDSTGNKIAKSIAQLNGTSWSPLGQGMNGPVYALCTYNGYLIAGGSFDSAGGKPALNIALWDGASWSPIGSGIGGSCTSLFQYNSSLIAGSSVANYIGRWNGASWSNLASGLNGQANCLTIFDGNLIVGGEFSTAGGRPADNIAQWSGDLGVNDIIDTGEIVSVYPNPCAGDFTIQFNNEKLSVKNTIQIYNMLGDKIYSKELKSTDFKSSVDISNHSSGIYLYRVTSEEGNLVATGKISIQK